MRRHQQTGFGRARPAAASLRRARVDALGVGVHQQFLQGNPVRRRTASAAPPRPSDRSTQCGSSAAQAGHQGLGGFRAVKIARWGRSSTPARPIPSSPAAAAPQGGPQQAKASVQRRSDGGHRARRTHEASSWRAKKGLPRLRRCSGSLVVHEPTLIASGPWIAPDSRQPRPLLHPP